MTAPEQAEPDVEVRAYARDVRAALADVPPERLVELLDDLEEHLTEVAAEGGEPLVLRLAPPAEYAAELRRAAGLAEPAPAAGAVGPSWSEGLSTSLDRLRGSGPYVAVRDFLPELRPAWWVVRAWAALIAVDALVAGRTSFPVPTLGLSPLVGLVLTGAAITWSVRRGQRVRQDPTLGHPRMALLANGALAVLAVVAVFAVGGAPDPAMAVDYGVPPTQDLTHEDGTPITNIHPYSSTGEPLSGVLLYDQDGRPIDNLATYTDDGGEIQRLDADPPAPANAFPQQQRVLTYDENGNPVWVTPSTAPAAPGQEQLPVPVPTQAPEPVPAPVPVPVPAPEPVP